MTHYESIDPDKVKEIFARSFAIDKRTGKVKACIELDCGNCLFNHANSNAPCRVARTKWLDQPGGRRKVQKEGHRKWIKGGGL